VVRTDAQRVDRTHRTVLLDVTVDVTPGRARRLEVVPADDQPTDGGLLAAAWSGAVQALPDDSGRVHLMLPFHLPAKGTCLPSADPLNPWPQPSPWPITVQVTVAEGGADRVVRFVEAIAAPESSTTDAATSWC
jgi:hypothetical protein